MTEDTTTAIEESVLGAYLKILLYNLGPMVLFLLLWEIIARMELIHPTLFPPVTKAFRTIYSLTLSGVLVTDVISSLRRLIVSVILGVFLGTTLGLAAGTIRRVERLLMPPFQFIISIPGTAIFPLTILWLGLSDKAVIAALTIEATLTIVFNTWTGVKGVDDVLIYAARSMGVRGLSLYTRVLVPAALPFMITGYRLGFARAWRILVAGEMLAATGEGLGFRVFEAQEFMRADIMYAAIIVVGVLGFLMERLILRSLETLTVERWGTLRGE